MLDVARDRSSACIAVAGKTADGNYHVEIVDRREGTEWLPGRFVDVVSKHKGVVWCFDNYGGTASLYPEVCRQIADRNLVRKLGIGNIFSNQEIVKGAQLFYDTVVQRRLRHRGQSSLDIAVSVAEKQYVGNSWTWKKTELADISPLRAASLALWALYSVPPPKEREWLIA